MKSLKFKSMSTWREGNEIVMSGIGVNGGQTAVRFDCSQENIRELAYALGQNLQVVREEQQSIEEYVKRCVE